MALMSMKRVSHSSHTIEYWRYDVLLSFRGIGSKHVHTFKDNKLKRREMIGSLLKTIEESRV
ncbi:hypothetical protein AAG906_017755 [Vitis piasezkii]